MESATMGRVIVSLKAQNQFDVERLMRGMIGPEEVRTIEIDDALVDSGATFLSLPERYVNELGLHKTRTRRLRTTNGIREAVMYSPVALTIQGRTCEVEVAQLPNNCPALVGQIPLEILDWVIDMKQHKLIGNPAHGGEWMGEEY